MCLGLLYRDMIWTLKAFDSKQPKGSFCNGANRLHSFVQHLSQVPGDALTFAEGFDANMKNMEHPGWENTRKESKALFDEIVKYM